MKETELKKEHPIADTAVIALFLVIVIGISLFGVLLPDQTYSENENRGLAGFPAFSVSALLSGKWTGEFSTYLSDQVPLRDEAVMLHAALELAMGKQQNNGVLLGKDGYLFVREDYPSLENLQTSLDSIEAFAAYAKTLGIPTCLSVAGRKIDVVPESLPNLYGTEMQDRFWAELDSRASALDNVNYLNLRDVILNSTSNEQMYYRTDHHWTAFGALEAYRAVCTAAGLKAREDSFFRVEKVSDAFFGTTWSSSGMTWIAPDTMHYLRWEGDEAVTTDLGGKVISGFYDYSKLEQKDKYGSFFGGNYGMMQIRGEGEGRGKLLVIKDSFAHSVLPMLGADYDIDVLDLRYYKQIPARLLEQGEYDAVLILCSSNLLTDSVAQGEALPFELLSVGIGKTA